MIKALAVILSLCVFWGVITGPANAAQLADNAVLIKGEDGVYYLSTEVEQSSSDNTQVDEVDVVETQPVESPLENVDVRIPQGFAQTFSGLLNGILSFVLIIAAILVLAFLLWGGFDWIMSGGDKGKTEQARQKIISAVIGIVIVASSFAILQLVIRFLGFTSLEDVFDSAGTIQGGADPAPPATPTPLPTPSPTPTPTPL